MAARDTTSKTAGKTARNSTATPASAARGTRTAPVAKAVPAVPAAQPIRPIATRAAERPAAAPAAVKPVKADKADKAKKPKLVRDSFTIPKTEYGVLDVLKERAARLGSPAKKSEVLRAGVKALEAMADTAFLACIKGVPSIKTGRPAKGA